MSHDRQLSQFRVNPSTAAHRPVFRPAFHRRPGAFRAGWLVVLALLIALPGAVRAEIDAQQFRADLEALGSLARPIGSPGYDQAAEYIESQLASMPGVEYRVHEYPIVVPETKSATLRIGESTHDVYPFWPAGVRLNATPAEGITGELVYIGNANYADIPPARLKGQIAVIEPSAKTFWTNAFYFGAKAVIVLGTPEATNQDLRAHDTVVPVNFPRFYLPEGELADRIRAAEPVGSATVQAQVNWTRKTGRNIYALVRGKQAVPSGWTLPGTPPALMFAAPIDASGLVPDLAYGAGQAAQSAAALAILGDVAADPLDRPVMVAFTGADSIQLRGMREMLMALSDVPRSWRPELAEVQALEQAAREDLARLREVRSEPSQLSVKSEKDRRTLDRVVKVIEIDLSLDQDELFRLRRQRAEELTADDQKRIDALVARQIELNSIRYAFNQQPENLKGSLLADAQTFIDEAIDHLAGNERQRGLIADYAARQQQLEQRIALYEWAADALGRPRDPSNSANNNRLIDVIVGLDIGGGGVRVGPMYWGEFTEASNISQIQEFRDWFSRQERAAIETPDAVPWMLPILPSLDFTPLMGAQAAQSWLVNPLPMRTEIAQAWGVPAFTMLTLDDARLWRDTPNDVLANVDADAILTQLTALNTLFRHMWNDASVHGPVELKWNHNTITGQVVGIAPGRPVPDLPRSGFRASYYYVRDQRTIPNIRQSTQNIGVRRTEVIDTNALGEYRIEAMPKIQGPQGPANDMQLFSVQVFQAQPDTGRILATSDLGKQAADLRTFADITLVLDPLQNVVFSCEEFSLAGLYDPRFLQNLGEVIPLDARRNSDPQRYNIVIDNQLMAGFVEPGARSYLVFRYGRVGNRLLLINMPESGQVRREGREIQPEGFTVPQLRNLDPLALVTADDFWRLDEMRLREYAAAGVSSSLIDTLHAEARQQIEQARAAYAANDGERMMEQANGAWANNARVYRATDEMARDVVRGAIFLLLLCVPFAFCMERLIVGTPSIYKQITGIFVIFAIMTAALWSFHPAFKISSSPLIIILAFAIIFMSAVVIYVVYSKFDTELKKIRSGRGTAEGASFTRASVLMSAVVLGIANMRRRRFRTALTATTIVLITFAVLCFTSTTRFIGTTQLPTGVATPYPGLLLRQRGFRPMPESMLNSLAPLIQHAAVEAGGDTGATTRPADRSLVERWWNINAGDPKDVLHLVAAGAEGPRVVSVQAALGLTPGEVDVTPIQDIIGPSFGRLVGGETHIIYMAEAIASQLNVTPGDRVQLGGIDLELAGVFSAERFDQKAMTLSGEPLAPLKYTPNALDAGGRNLNNNDVESLELDGSATASEAGSSYEHLSATQFVIVPKAISRILPNSSLRGVAIKLAEPGTPADLADAEVDRVGGELAKRFAVAMFAGYSDGVRMVAAGNLSSVSGAGQVAIPLAIAGLIIFNTMMGSIAERRREIHVYTSLGLAPMHVGALFVAEAMTYGLIGTVFGYIIGQGVGTLLLNLGWLGSATLNYSGTSAIATMGLILLIVLLSALVPARLASKIAAPSIERSWRVPLPKGDQIVADLPFTINKTAADGALAYLAEFFDAHQEGSIGKFSAGKIEPITIPDEQGRMSRGLQSIIWLTPFDLGVRQHLMLLIHPGQFEEIYEVQVVLQRLSGDDGSWYRMNRTFLTELRKQFLQWRSLSPQRMLDYVEESRRLFERVPEQVVTTARGEEVRLA